MTKRNTYHSTEELRAMAVDTPHKFLNFRVAQLLSRGWEVKSIYTHNGLQVVIVYNKTIAAGKYALSVVYPNGLMRTVHDKSISWNWGDVRKYANATEPTPGLDYKE